MKLKALFMIYLVISITFTVYLLPVTAEDDGKACCEQTLSGESCVYTSSSQCDDSYKVANYQKCEDTSFCKLGCCISPDGSCSKQTSQAACENAGYTWNPDATCDSVKECNKGCCVLAGASCAYVTEKKCNNILLDYPELSKDFRQSKSEQECSDICRQADRGCCVKSANEECVWTSRATCNMQDGIGGEGFYEGLFCSNNNLPCEQCKAHSYKGCLDGTDDVYWFDSCGNPEGVAEDCDYAKGTLCGQTQDGDYVCKSLDCPTTWDNPVVEGDGGRRINGESWCEFDGAIGPSLDLPGSRHYRHICINGEEIVEPCKDFREEVCLQSDVYETLNTGIKETAEGKISATAQNYLFSEAACKENRWKDCTTICNTAKDKTSPEDIALAMKLDKECCERSDLRDCFWAGDENSGTCIPQHPPGFRFWNPQKQTKSATTQTASDQTCSTATKKCTTVFTKMIYTNWKWSCVKEGNCECFSNDYIKEQNNYCRSIGDCGAHYNYIGGFSKEGFLRSWDHSYQGWDIIFDRGKSFQSSYYNRQSEEPKMQVDQTMAGAFEEVWHKANKELYLSNLNAEDVYKDKKIAQAITKGIGITVQLTGLILKAIGTSAASSAASWVSGIGALVTLYIVLTEIVFRKYQKRTVTTECKLWQPPPGSDNCAKCDEDPMSPCSEYKCMSLGAGCKFIKENEGTSRPKCIAADPNDVNKPIITPWNEAFKLTYQGKDITTDYSIVEKQNGYLIGSKKLPAFSKLYFGIQTNEPSMCKLDKELKYTFNDLSLRFNESYFDKVHNYYIGNLQPATDYKFYVICKDANGNPKDDKRSPPYVIEFSTDRAPDLEPPRLISSSIPDMGYVAANANETSLTLVVDEVSPFSCRASTQDMPFDQMPLNMTCAEMPPDSIYSKYAECQVKLPVRDGLNTYYFRCRDEPENSQVRNENSESYIWRASKAEPLIITALSPSGTIYSSNITLQVKTAKGALNGKSICYYNNIEFFNTNSTYHTQVLSGLTKQQYDYIIECRDIANNVARENLSFTVDIDTEPPEITGLSYTGALLEVMFNEDASCSYSTNNEDYSQLPTSQIVSINVDPLTEKIYLTCKDVHDNEMSSTIFLRTQLQPPV